MLTQILIEVAEATSVLATNGGWFECKVTIGDVLTLIGIIIAIWQFSCSSKESRNQALSNQKETWFLNVIVLPQLDEINQFYQKLIEKIGADKKQVSVLRKENYDQCTLKIAELKQQRKQEINNCFDHIIALVMSYDVKLGREVSDVIMKLEDTYVEMIDYFVKDKDVENVRAIILQNEQILISQLNRGLRKTS